MTRPSTEDSRMTFEQLNTAHASAIDTGEIPSPATPEGAAISRGAVLDAITSHAHYDEDWGDMVEAIRSLPPQDGEREASALVALQAMVDTFHPAIKEVDEERIAAVARAEKAEARAAELEAENERIGDLFDDLCHFRTPEQRRAYLTGGLAALTAQPVAQEPWGYYHPQSGLTSHVQVHGGWLPLYDHPATPAPVEAKGEGQEPVAWMIEDLILPAIYITTEPKYAQRKQEYRYEGKATAKVTPLYAHPATPAPVEAGLLERLTNAAITIGMCDDGDGADAVREAIAALRAQSAPVGGEGGEG